MPGPSLSAAVGALTTSVPAIRDHMLTNAERVDLARLLTCIDTMQGAKEKVKILKTSPYWELMQELDKVAVHRLRDELDLYHGCAVDVLHALRRYHGSFSSDVASYKTLTCRIPRYWNHAVRIERTLREILSRYNAVLRGERRLKDSLPVDDTVARYSPEPLVEEPHTFHSGSSNPELEMLPLKDEDLTYIRRCTCNSGRSIHIAINIPAWAAYEQPWTP